MAQRGTAHVEVRGFREARSSRALVGDHHRHRVAGASSVPSAFDLPPIEFKEWSLISSQARSER